MKIFISPAPLLAIGIVAVAVAYFSGCTTAQQTTAYNTIFTTEATVTQGIDWYDTLVIKGTIPTNSVPVVSRAYNDFQAATLVAIAVVQGNSNAVAPPSLVLQASGVLNLITNSSKGF